MMLVPGTVTGIIRTKGVPMHLECSSSLWSRAVRMDVASLEPRAYLHAEKSNEM